MLDDPGVPLSPKLHFVVELHQLAPSELSIVMACKDMDAPTSLGKFGPLSHSTRSISSPMALAITSESTSSKENPGYPIDGTELPKYM
jgi:hypothetical protein